MTPDGHEWLTPTEVAQRLRVNEKTVRRWLGEGKLRGSLLGRVWRISPTALEEFMRAHEPKPTLPDELTEIEEALDPGNQDV